MSEPSAPIIEVYSTFQGEGSFIGERQLFIRFQDCEFNCRYCDTPLSFVINRFCRVENPPFAKKFNQYLNPVSIDLLGEIVSSFDDRTITLTGGEPLQKVDFLKKWLPTLNRSRHILLETAGIHFAELREIVDYIDIVGMDFKLKSSTGMHPWWQEHEMFLKTVLEHKKEVYVKTIMTRDTTLEDLQKGIKLLVSLDHKIPLILQPASITNRFQASPSMEQMYQWQTAALEYLPNVRVIPQVHKQMGVM